jgi:hypothetical protein
MSAILWFIGITFLLGPMAGAAYAMANNVPALETAAAISLIHVLLVPVWFAIFRLMRYEFRYYQRTVGKLSGTAKLTKRIEKIAQKGLLDFERRFRRWSFGTAVFGFTFMFGVSWAALLASVLNMEMSTIFVSVAAGAVASSIFWTFVVFSFGGFLPETWMIYLVVGVLTLMMLAHGKIRERKYLHEMSKSLKKMGIQS